MAQKAPDLLAELLSRPYLAGIIFLFFTPGVFSALFHFFPILLGTAAWAGAAALYKQKPKEENNGEVKPKGGGERLEYGVPVSLTEEALVAAGVKSDTDLNVGLEKQQHGRPIENGNDENREGKLTEGRENEHALINAAAVSANKAAEADAAVSGSGASRNVPSGAAFAQKEEPAKGLKEASGPPEVLFLYGSQTGNAMEIAKSFNAEAPSHGIKSHVLALSEKPLQTLSGARFAVFVVSSTGDGDPPENCERFHNALKRKTNPPGMLSGLHFTVCGLGDSNYTTYMGVPRVFNQKLAELGAKSFYKSCEADEVDGLEEVVEKWAAGMWGPLKTAVEAAQGEDPIDQSNTFEAEIKAPSPALVGVPPLQPCRVRLIWQNDEENLGGSDKEILAEDTAIADGKYSAESPFMAAITDAHYMTAGWSDRKVIHLELDISGSNIKYRAGDCIGILPINNEELVENLLKRLGVKGDEVFSVAPLKGDEGALTGGQKLLGHVGWPCTVREALLKHCDLTAVPRKGLLRVLAEYCTEEGEKNKLLELCSRGGREAYRAEIQEGRPNLLNLLSAYPSCQPPLAHLLDSLPPLVGRLYSLTSSQLDNPNRVQVAFSVVREEFTKGQIFEGVCTSWLDRLLKLRSDAPPLRVAMYHKPGGDFKLPEDVSAPLVMVGPGTGVAPFRGFLQERRARLGKGEAEAGEAWLFAGCRREEEDFLYKEDLLGFARDGTLTRLITAFSRATDKKVYVQHKIIENGEKMASLMQHPKGHVFICGDGANMAREVHEALATILQQHAGMSDKEATAFLVNMFKEKRFVKDVWS